MTNDNSMTKRSSYEEYSESSVAKALASGKKVALFFYADRCPTCRRLNTDIQKKIDTLPSNSIVFKVDYDTARDLKKQYGVTSQHTVVALNNDLSIKSKIIG